MCFELFVRVNFQLRNKEAKDKSQYVEDPIFLGV